MPVSEQLHMYKKTLLVSFIYPLDLRDNAIDVKHRAIVTQNHFRRYQQYHVRLFFIWFLIFFLRYMPIKKQTPVLSSTTYKESLMKLSLSVFLGHSNVLQDFPDTAMFSMGIEPATLQSLTQHSNQLSYSAAYIGFIGCKCILGLL